MLSNSIAIVSGKGGVGKSSVAANLAGIAAAGNYRVLLIDLDPQGNLGRDLGYRERDGVDDNGLALVRALQFGDPLTVQQGIRERLDVIPGGSQLYFLSDAEQAMASRMDSPDLALYNALAEVAPSYNLIVIDCPPGEGYLQRMAMTASRFVVVPTQGDAASQDGLDRVASLFTRTRQLNPHLELLGVFLFDIPAGPAGSRIRTESAERILAGIGSFAPLFETSIRTAKRLARELRERGMLAHEYEGLAVSAPKWWEPDYDPNTRVAGTGGSASNLAGDYHALANEILGEFSRRMSAAPVE